MQLHFVCQLFVDVLLTEFPNLIALNRLATDFYNGIRIVSSVYKRGDKREVMCTVM